MIQVENQYSLKIIKQEEFELYYNLIDENRKRLARYFPGTMRAVQNIDQAESYLKILQEKHGKKEIYPFGFYENQKLIGWISIKNIDWSIPKCELGYYLDKDYEGKGLMSKIVGEIVKYSFEELKMEKIFLRIGLDNIGSQKIALKNNFEKEGLLKREFRTETGELVDLIYYGKLRQ